MTLEIQVGGTDVKRLCRSPETLLSRPGPGAGTRLAKSRPGAATSSAIATALVVRF